MSDGTGIEWTWTIVNGKIIKGATWNIVVGCTKIDPLCANCYATRDAIRMAANPNPLIQLVYKGIAKVQGNGIPNFTGLVKPLEDRLDQPLRWTRGHKIFVCGQSDLWHEDVPFEFMGKAFDIMLKAKHNTYIALTKRMDRLIEFYVWYMKTRNMSPVDFFYAFRHVWFGFSAGTQEGFDERYPLSAKLYVETKFLSAEPLLEKMDISAALTGDIVSQLSWFIGGGESAPLERLRTTPLDAVYSFRDQVVQAGKKLFWKQWGNKAPISQVAAEIRNDPANHGKVLPDGYIYFPHKKTAGRLIDSVLHNDFPA